MSTKYYGPPETLYEAVHDLADRRTLIASARPADLPRLKKTHHQLMLDKMERIIKAVIDHSGVQEAELCGSRGQFHVSWTRMLAMVLIKTNTGLTTRIIGERFRRTHNSVICACHSVTRLTSVEPMLAQDLAKLRAYVANF